MSLFGAAAVVHTVPYAAPDTGGSQAHPATLVDALCMMQLHEEMQQGNAVQLPIAAAWLPGWLQVVKQRRLQPAGIRSSNATKALFPINRNRFAEEPGCC